MSKAKHTRKVSNVASIEFGGSPDIDENSLAESPQRAIASLELDPEEQVIFDDNISMVKIIAQSIYHKLTGTQIMELQDLVQVGMVGLITAIKNNNPDKNARFQTYANYRIKGQIMDALKDTDFLSRNSREFYKKEMEIRRQLTANLCRPPADEEVALHMDLDLNTYRKKSLFNSAPPISLNNAFGQIANTYPGPSNDDPAVIFYKEKTHKTAVEALKKAIHALPPVQKELVMNYLQDKSVAEIAGEMKMTQNQATYILRKAHTAMKEHLFDTEFQDFSYK